MQAAAVMSSRSSIITLVCVVAVACFIAGYFVGGVVSKDSSKGEGLFVGTQMDGGLATDELGDSGAQSVSPERDELQLARPPILDSQELSRRASQARNAVPESDRGEGVIAGRVEAEDGGPLAGVQIEVRLWQSSVHASRQASDPRSTISRANSLDHGVAKLERSWAAKGLVAMATTATDGSFEVTGLRSELYSLSATLKGYRIACRGTAAIDPVRFPDRKFVFDACALHSVRIDIVRRADDSPVDAAVLTLVTYHDIEWVEWTRGNPTVWVATRQFEVQARADPIPGGVDSFAAAWVSDSVPVDATTDAKLTLTLNRTCVVRGRVEGNATVRDDLRAVQAVRLGVGEQFDPSVPVDSPDETYSYEGLFLFDNLRPGRYAICIVDQELVPEAHVVVDAVPGIVDVVLQRPALNPSDWMIVKVLTPGGAPVDEPEFSFEFQRSPESDVQSIWASQHRQPGGAVLVKTKGEFADWPANGSLWLVATSPKYGRARVAVVHDQRVAQLQFLEPCELEVRIQGEFGMGQFVVRVFDEHSNPGDSTEVAVARMRRGDWGSGPIINHQGVVRFRGLSPGRVSVRLDRESLWSSSYYAEQEIVLGGKDHQLTFVAPSVFELSVRVHPCESSRTVLLFEFDDDGEESVIGEVVTSANGRAIFRSLSAGTYVVRDGDTGKRVRVSVPGPEAFLKL